MKRLPAPRACLTLWAALCAAALLCSLSTRAAVETTNSSAAFPPIQNRVAHPDVLEQLSNLTWNTVEHWGLYASLVLAYLVVAVAISRTLNQFMQGRLKRWAERSTNQWNDLVVNLLNGPVQVVSLAALLSFGLEYSQWDANMRLWCSRVINVLVAVSILMVALKGIDTAVELWRRRLPDDGEKDFHHNFLLLVGKLAKLAVIVVGAFTLLSHLGVDIKPALAAGSVAGLAFGLAAQDTVSNLFGAVVVFVDRPFRIGERIKVGEVDGVVEAIGVRATRVRSVDGFLVTVPNKNIGSNTVVNISRRPAIKVELNYGLTYDTSAPRLREAAALLEAIFRAHPKTKDVVVTFDKFLDSALNLNVSYSCGTTDWKEYCRSLQEIQLEVKARFDAAKFDFAFPSQTTYHKFEDGAAGLAIPPNPPLAR